MANQVNINIVGHDNTSGVIGRGNSGVVGSLTELNSAIGLIKQGLAAVNQVYDATIGEEMAYAIQTGKTAQVLGTSVEETSRLVQAGDDMGVSIDSWTNTLEFASKNGLQPTIENIANESDRLLAMTDITQRNEEAAKQFGRQWFDNAKIILAGGDTIRQLAASQEAGLVVTQQMVDDAEAARVAQDNLDDAVTAVSNRFSADYVPSITKAINSLLLLTGNTNKQTDAMILNARVQRGLGDPDARAKALQAEGLAYQNQVEPITEVSDVLSDLNADQWDVHGSAAAVGDEFQDNTTKIYAEADAVAALKSTQEDLAKAQDNLAGAEDQLKNAQQNLNNELSGNAVAAIERTNQSYARQLAALKIQDEAFGTHAAVAVEKTKDVDDATKAFMNSPQSETDKAAYLKRLDEIKAKYAETDTSIETSKAKVKELQDQIDKLNSKTITITTILNTINQGGGGGGGTGGQTPMPSGDPGTGYEWHWNGTSWVRKKLKEFASGGSVAGGVPIVVGENGPEVFVPNGSGKIENNNYYNMTIHSNARTENLQSDFSLMKSLSSPGV